MSFNVTRFLNKIVSSFGTPSDGDVLKWDAERRRFRFAPEAEGGGGGGTVSVDVALEGDGSGGDPLSVKVDGETIGVNDDNELEALGGGGGAPAGADTQVQFNDGGDLGASPGLTYDKATDTLTLGSNHTPGYPIIEMKGQPTGSGVQFKISTPASRDGYFFWTIDGNGTFQFGVSQANGGRFFAYSAATHKFMWSYGGADATENVLRTEGAFAPQEGYLASDDTPGITAGPFTSITSIEVKDGLVVGLTGS